MSPKQIRRLQIFIILFLSTLTLYVLFKEAEKPIEETLVLSPELESSEKTKIEDPVKKENLPVASNEITLDLKDLTPEQIKTFKEFKEKSLAIKEKLPRKSDLQNLKDDEVHSIPQELLATGRELGQLKEYVLRYPDFKALQEEAKEFYKSCADDEAYPTSIRSLCLFNRLQLAKNSGEKFDISPYPLEIKELVLELNPFTR
jgi:hypothetical protein